MNPLSPQVKSVEAFQRDIEPAIIAARNELVTAENFMAYKDNYSIARYMDDGKTVYSLHSRMFFFTELDTDLIRDTYNKRLLPLGFELSEDRWTSGGVEIVDYVWTNEEYHAAVSATTRLGEQTSTYYYTGHSNGRVHWQPAAADRPARTHPRLVRPQPPARRTGMTQQPTARRGARPLRYALRG